MNLRISLDSAEAVKALLEDKSNEVVVSIQNKALKQFVSEECVQKIDNKLKGTILAKALHFSNDIMNSGLFVDSLSDATKEAIQSYIERCIENTIYRSRLKLIEKFNSILSDSSTTVEDCIKKRVKEEFDTCVRRQLQDAIHAQLKEYFSKKD